MIKDKIMLNRKGVKAYHFVVEYMQTWMSCDRKTAEKIVDGMYFATLTQCAQSGMVQYPNGISYIHGKQAEILGLVERYKCIGADGTRLRDVIPEIFTAMSKSAVLQILALAVLDHLNEIGMTVEELQSCIKPPENI